VGFSKMSDEAGSGANMPSDAQGGGARLYGATGERLRPTGRQDQNQSDQLADFIQQQPLTAALVALVIGYLLGKMT
jgi:hypothetical protein